MNGPAGVPAGITPERTTNPSPGPDPPRATKTRPRIGSTSRVQPPPRLVELAVDKGIRTVFASPQFRTREAEVIANEIGAKVVLVSPLEEDYLDNLRRAAQALAER